MADTTPVANQIVPPDPMRGINTFSGILGIRQQQQALQTGQFQQATAQAESQQAQQKNKELQAAQAVALQGAKGGAYTNGDGTFNRQKMANDISRVAPTYGQPIAGQLLSQANEIVANQQAHQALTVERKKEIGNTFASLAADPELDNTKFIDAIETLRQQHPGEQEFSRMLTSMSTHMPGQADTQTLRSLAGRWSAAATGEPQATPTSMDVGGQVQPGAANRFTGAFTPAGAGINKTLNPAQQPGYLERAAAAGASGGAGAQNDETLYNQITQGGTRVGQMKSLAGEVQQLAREVKTGKYSKEGSALWTAIAQRVPGFDSANLTQATRRQLLGKYTQQLMLQAEQANGASTDAAQAHVQAAMPDPDHMTPEAIVDAARYVSGQADVAGARAQLAIKHRGLQGNSQGLRAVDTMFMSQADPRSFVYKGLKPGDDRRQYLRDHPDFKNKLLLQLHQAGNE